jgi:hypothetical protein
MTMPRVLAVETLDGLDAHDPVARRSRRDLRRIHRLMGTRSILLRGLAALRTTRRGGTLRVLELGAGDGTLMLGVARKMARAGVRAQLTLLDRQPCVERSTIDGYAQIGWSVVASVTDVADWIAQDPDARQSGSVAARWDAIVVNLFLHHFTAQQLAPMLGAIAARTDRFFACEPRRGWLALAASHLVGAIGANAVTREDAVLSVRAGFAASELSALWRAPRDEWQLHEYRAGLFSHCLHAARRTLS